MSINFLPEKFSRVTQIDVVVPVSDQPDLTDPATGRAVVPAFVQLHLRRDAGMPKGDREYAVVSVSGPRRLKSGDIGKEVTTFGWERARNNGRHGDVDRPDWLATVVSGLMPGGWPLQLVELTANTEGGARDE
ncbi:hypothetical protein [Streptomyces sp. KN37]|uniref:hypothetical protein n=1 Tax=Streptomyces sp. KN37 TaxID=3090667 RepID=UPI002A759357|nr:hypothetical protein [Streptomyces sp. KN37]WPO70259.1 hypothetical protein R9806_06250 [Streptomyces sp. KN37]WPO73973.1 hypothetical protein R9806_26825 [Streptomyces sp. KN37]